MSEREEFEHWMENNRGRCDFDFRKDNEGDYVIPSIDECWDTWQAARAKRDVEPVSLRHALQRVDPLAYNNFEDLLSHMISEGITANSPAEKVPDWIACSERLPSREDEDERGDLWTSYKGRVARNNSTFVCAFLAQCDPNELRWMPTGLRKPEPFKDITQ